MKQKMYSRTVFTLAIIGACMATLINCTILFGEVYTGVKMAASLLGYQTDSYAWPDGDNDPSGQDYDDNGDGEKSAEDLEGVDPSEEKLIDIPSYEAEKTTVTTNRQNYSLQKKKDDGSIIYFNVDYPEVSGVDEAHAAAINKVLKDTALVTADTYYFDGNEGRDLQVDGEPVFVISEVTYNITYLSDGYISVVYEDKYCAGNYNMQYIDMRACNINLKDGTVYTLKDIVKGGADMAEDFQQKLDDKYQTQEAIYGITEDEYAGMLDGGKTEDGSYMGFYRTENGIELFVTFHYDSNENYWVGWFRIPYNLTDIEDFKTENNFWTLFQ